MILNILFNFACKEETKCPSMNTGATIASSYSRNGKKGLKTGKWFVLYVVE